MDRIVARGETSDAKLSFDVNCEVYPIKEGEKLSVVLASTLALDGTPSDGVYDQSGKVGLP